MRRRKLVQVGDVAVSLPWFSHGMTPTGHKYRLPLVMGVGDVVFIPKATKEEENDMGLFGKMLGGKAKDAVQKFSGNTDFLEALCAGCALTAAAEGGIDDAEYDQALKVIQSNSAISAGFSPRDIESAFSRMAPKTSSRMGKSELKREIEEAVKRDKGMAEAIVLACLDVADTGGISPAEDAVMKQIAEICGVNYQKLKEG